MYAWGYLPLDTSHLKLSVRSPLGKSTKSYLGDSGQNKTPMTRGTAGMKAEPSCNLLYIIRKRVAVEFRRLHTAIVEAVTST